ncbi:hypothetical protein SB5439_04762 [Klebsiella variicola]|nr:hypothetical protein SB5439_04762 [Klebsiella variicola]
MASWECGKHINFADSHDCGKEVNLMADRDCGKQVNFEGNRNCGKQVKFGMQCGKYSKFSIPPYVRNIPRGI